MSLGAMLEAILGIWSAALLRDPMWGAEPSRAPSHALQLAMGQAEHDRRRCGRGRTEFTILVTPNSPLQVPQ